MMAGKGDARRIVRRKPMCWNYNAPERRVRTVQPER